MLIFSILFMAIRCVVGAYLEDVTNSDSECYSLIVVSVALGVAFLLFLEEKGHDIGRRCLILAAWIYAAKLNLEVAVFLKSLISAVFVCNLIKMRILQFIKKTELPGWLVILLLII